MAASNVAVEVLSTDDIDEMLANQRPIVTAGKSTDLDDLMQSFENDTSIYDAPFRYPPRINRDDDIIERADDIMERVIDIQDSNAEMRTTLAEVVEELQQMRMELQELRLALRSR